MADSKISALPASTVPLAGTEVVPLVQSSTTKQVSIANLTAGRAVSAASLSLTTTPLPVSSGGTGINLLTANGIAYASSSSLLATSGNLTYSGTTVTNTGGIFTSKAPGAGFYGASDAGVTTGYLAFNQYTGVTLSSANANAIKFEVNGGLVLSLASGGNVGIGATANASAILDAQSTTKGVRMPNMTTTQKNAISSPAAGLMVFDTTLAKLCVYSGAAWQTITSV